MTAGRCAAAALALAACQPDLSIDQLTRPPRYSKAIDDQLKAVRDESGALFLRLRGPEPGCRYTVDQPDARVIDKSLTELVATAEAGDQIGARRGATQLRGDWRRVERAFAAHRGACLPSRRVASLQRRFQRRLGGLLRYEESAPPS